MYRIRLLIILLLCALGTMAQTQRVTVSGTAGAVDIDRGGYGATEFDRIPTDFFNYSKTDSNGRIWVKNGNFYYHDGIARTQVLTAKDSNQIKIWGAAGAGLVGSVFGRTGAVVAVDSDYNFSQIAGKPHSLSGYGILDPVVVTSGSYSNPTWITALAAGKITGAPWLTSVSGISVGGALSGTLPNPSIINSGVTAGTYAYPSSVIVGADGRITAIVAGSTPTSYSSAGYIGQSGNIFYLDTSAYKAATKTDLNAYYLASNPSSYISRSGISGTAPVDYNNATGVISMHVADATHSGYTSSSDWGVFNGKQDALNGTGFVKVSGTTVSYDNSVYLTAVPTTTINSVVISFGGANTITAAAGTLTGSTLNATVTTSSLVTVATITTGTWTATPIADPYVASSSNWNTAYSNRIASFSTTGSGAASFTPGGNLNIPTPTLAALGGTTDHAALTDLVWTASGHLGAGAGLAGFNSSSVAIVYTLSGSGTTIPTTSVSVLASLATVGTITTGIWNGSSISTTYTDAKIKTVTGTTNRLTIGGTSTDPTFDISTSYLGQSTITTVGTITSGVWTGSSISTTYTDAKIKTVTGTSGRLTVGGTATDPTFDISSSYVGQNTITTVGTLTSGTWNASTIAEGYGGTNQTTYTLGDILYASASNTLSKLAGNTTSTKKFLTQTGTGSVSAAPGWNVLVAGDVPDISATYSVKAGNTSLVTVGTITTGTWNGTRLTSSYIPTDAAYYDIVQGWTKGQYSLPVSLTDAATIAVDLSLGQHFQVVLAGSRTLGVPTNIFAGQTGFIDLWQDNTGSRVLTPAWIYGGSGGTAIVLSTGKNSLDVVSYAVNYYSSATVTISNASPAVVTQTGHGYPTNAVVKLQLTTTGSLPTGLSASTTYYATIVDANTYKLSTSFANAQAGTFINTSSAGSGTHTSTIGNITLTVLTDSR